MAIELINIGNLANDGTGDELRVAFRKINQNFEDVDLRLGDAVEGINTGTGEGIFRGRNGNDLEFKSLVAGPNVSITGNPASIEIAAPDALVDTPIITDSGSYILTTGNSIRLYGGDGVNTSVNVLDNSIVIDKTSRLADDTAPVLAGDLDADLNDINNVNRITANDFVGGTFQGNFLGQLNGVSTDIIESFFYDFDFGGFNTSNLRGFYDFIVQAIDVEFGTIVDPSGIGTDFGTFA